MVNMKFKELNETDKKVIKFAYFTKLLVRLSRLNEQDLPLQSSNMAYDRGSTRWSVERLDDYTLRLILHTKNSKMSKYVLIKLQENKLFAEYKANKRGLSFEDSFVYKIADLVFDEDGNIVYESDNDWHLLAYESLGNVLFEDLVDQVLKLAKDMKIPTTEINKDLDFQTHLYNKLGYFQS